MRIARNQPSWIYSKVYLRHSLQKLKYMDSKARLYVVFSSLTLAVKPLSYWSVFLWLLLASYIPVCVLYFVCVLFFSRPGCLQLAIYILQQSSTNSITIYTSYQLDNSTKSFGNNKALGSGSLLLNWFHDSRACSTPWKLDFRKVGTAFVCLLFVTRSDSDRMP